MTYCVVLKSGKVMVFRYNKGIEVLMSDIEKNKWLVVDSYSIYENPLDGEEFEDVEVNQAAIRTCEIQTIEYYVEKEVYR